MLILCANCVFSQEVIDRTSEKDSALNKGLEELSLSEWKKLKDFEERLSRAEQTKLVKEEQFRAYTRDSVQILGVKLMAVKLLDKKELLNRDMAENPTYYAKLLDELRDSKIPQKEYLFLEEKMAFITQETLSQKLTQSKWLNMVLIILCCSLFFSTVYFRTKRKSLPLPELSRQEVTVRNLILKGKTNKEIANELFISLSTVKTHITNIYAKLNVVNRKELLQKGTGTST